MSYINDTSVYAESRPSQTGQTEEYRSTEPLLPILLAQNSPESAEPVQPTEEANTAEPSSEAKAKEQNASAAKTAFENSRDKLVSRRSIQAKIRQKVSIGDKQFTAAGSYVQGSDLKLRLQMEVFLGSSQKPPAGKLLQVCDGQILWTRHEIDETPRITRRDVRKILNAAQANPNLPESVLVAELGLGGLPALVASLEKSMSFHSVREESVDGTPYTVVDGSWNMQSLRRFGVTQPNSKQPLPRHVPDAVRIYFEKRTDFPRRVLYLKRPAAKNYLRPMVTLDFLEVVLDADVSDETFQFQPDEDVLQVDVTNTYLKQLQRAATAGQFAPEQTDAAQNPPESTGPGESTGSAGVDQ
jgi:hypothetical protein